MSIRVKSFLKDVGGAGRVTEARREKLGIEKPENPSQVGKRRYARGRAYDPNRYADEMAAAEEVNEPVEETAAQTEGEPEQSQENSET